MDSKLTSLEKQASTNNDPIYFISMILINLISYSISAYFVNRINTLSSFILSTGTISSNSPYYTWIFVCTGKITSVETPVILNIDVGQSPLVSFLGKLTGYISFNDQSLINVDEIMTYAFNYHEKVLILTISMKNVSSPPPVVFSFNITLKASNNKLPISCKCETGFEVHGFPLSRAYTKYLIPTAIKAKKGYVCRPTPKKLVENRYRKCSKICKTSLLYTVKDVNQKGNLKSSYQDVQCCQQFIVSTSYKNNNMNLFCKELENNKLGNN